MITAHDARVLMADTSRPKFSLENAKLIWTCGRINSFIEKAAKFGEKFVFLEYNEEFAKRNFKYMAKLYEEQGYMVAYNTHSALGCCLPIGFGVYWDFNGLDYEQARDFNNCNYHTGIEKKYLRGKCDEDIKEDVKLVHRFIRRLNDYRFQNLILSSEMRALENLIGYSEEIIKCLEYGTQLDFTSKIQVIPAEDD